ncbi:MAG: PAS domain-containing protein [Acidobacteria bacterium]|nr:PAS domain-containing protein [Acidobacteriota bacterium]
MITPIERKLLSYLGVILIVLITLVCLVYLGVRTMTKAGSEVTHTLQVKEEIAELSAEINHAAEQAREYLLTGNQQSVETFNVLKQQLPLQIQRIKELTVDNAAQQERLAQVQNLIEQRMSLNDQMIRARQRDDYETFRPILFGAPLAQVRVRITQTIHEMDKVEEQLYSERIAKQTSKARLAAAVAVISTLIAAALLVVTGVSLRREIARHLAGEEKLREREQQLRLALGASKAGLWFWDLTTKEVAWSDENYAVFGIAPGSCVPSYDLWSGFLYSEDRERVERELETALAEHKEFKTEHRIVWPDGEVRRILVRGTTIFDSKGQPVSMSGIDLDVTEFRRTEESLYESEERFRQIAENIDAVLWIRNFASGKLEFFSSGSERLWGIPAEKLMTGSAQWFEYIHPDDRAEARALMQEQITTDSLDMEYRIVTPEGRMRWVRDRAFAVKDRAGVTRRIVGFSVDTTERKQAEEIKAALLAREQEARAQAETANRTKDEFLAIVSHELRSPLNAMLGWARVLRSEGVDQETHDHAIQVIEQSAEMQSRLIEDLLDSARIASGKLRIESRAVNLLPAIKSAIDTVFQEAERKGILIETELDAETDRVNGDAERLQQIVWNLLANAVKFTPSGGKVFVGLKRETPWATITVRDTGLGIKANDLPHIFDRFQQADSSNTRRAGGLGLGLALVKNLVELHNGTITASSDGENLGSIFTVRLPLQTATITKPEIEVISKGLSGPLSFPPVLGGLHILAVDDEAPVRDLVATLLKKYGATVTSAASTTEAMALLTANENAEQFDLLVSDIGMPGENGYTLMRRIRQLPVPLGQIPAVALTAFGRSEDRISALEAGFQMHVPKPVEPTELMMVIASLTGRTTNSPQG